MNILLKFQLPSSTGLGLTVFELKDRLLSHSINQLNYHRGDCSTAPATLGLLKKTLGAKSNAFQ